MSGVSERRLSFCSIRVLPSRIVEVVPDEGIEINLSMTEELDRVMLDLMGGVFAVLVDKVNSYSVTFDAQMAIGSKRVVVATAVVAYDSLGEMGTNQIKAMSAEGEEKQIDIFFDKDHAIDWLETKMATFL